MLGSEVALLEQGIETGIAVGHGHADSLQGLCVLLVYSSIQCLVNPVKGFVVLSLATIILLQSEVILVEISVTHLVVIQAGG